MSAMRKEIPDTMQGFNALHKGAMQAGGGPPVPRPGAGATTTTTEAARRPGGARC